MWVELETLTCSEHFIRKLVCFCVCFDFLNLLYYVYTHSINLVRW